MENSYPHRMKLTALYLGIRPLQITGTHPLQMTGIYRQQIHCSLIKMLTQMELYLCAPIMHTVSTTLTLRTTKSLSTLIRRTMSTTLTLRTTKFPSIPKMRTMSTTLTLRTTKSPSTLTMRIRIEGGIRVRSGDVKEHSEKYKTSKVEEMDPSNQTVYSCS